MLDQFTRWQSTNGDYPGTLQKAQLDRSSCRRTWSSGSRRYHRAVVSAIPAEVVLSRLSAEDRRAVETFRDELRRRYGQRVKDLRLYGSKVRGDDHDESDIDVLVLTEGRDAALARSIGELAQSISTWLSPFIEAFDDYHAPSSRVTGYYRELRRESVRL